MRNLTVYGSLLEGFGNWKHHLDNDESVKQGEHVIEGKFKMVSFGGFPGLIIDPSLERDTKVFVETYEVSNRVFKSVERLEGYPDFYGRAKIDTPFGESEVYVLPNQGYNATSKFLVPEDENGVINWRKYRMK